MRPIPNVNSKLYAKPCVNLVLPKLRLLSAPFIESRGEHTHGNSGVRLTS